MELLLNRVHPKGVSLLVEVFLIGNIVKLNTAQHS
jgi:hypothetical protein